MISLSAGSGGTVSGGGKYAKDSLASISATPSEGYIFDGWYENGKLLHEIPESYEFNVVSNRAIEAKFKPNNLSITDVEIFGSCQVNEQLTFTGFAEGGIQALQWSFEIYDETGTICHSKERSMDNFTEWVPTSNKSYTIKAWCIDSTGFEDCYTKQFEVSINKTFREVTDITQQCRLNGSSVWQSLTPSLNTNGIAGIRLVTSNKPYYFKYRTRDNTHGWLDYVFSTNANDYAGWPGYSMTNVEIQVYDDSGKRIFDDYIIMYRAKVAGEWLDWVSNGSSDAMQTIKSEFNLLEIWIL